MNLKKVYPFFSFRGRWLLCLRGPLLFLFLVICSIGQPEAQGENHFASGVKVLAALPSAVYDWSPDGQRLAYATDDGIWVVEAPDFRQPRRLVRKGLGEAHPIRQLRWSPDGQKLAFESPRPGDEWSTIWLTDAEGSQVRDLFPPGGPLGYPGRGEGISSWSSNHEIAFVDGCGTGCIALKKVDTENAPYYWSLCEQVVNTGIVGAGYHWAPTGERAVAELDSGNLGLVDPKDAIKVSGPSFDYSHRFCPSAIQGCVSEEETIKGQLYQFTDWSPSGKHVLYMGWACWYEPVRESGITLYLWNVDEGRQEQLMSNAGWATWSPDGTKIAFLLFGEPRYDNAHRIISTDFAPEKPGQVSVGIMAISTREVHTLIPLAYAGLLVEKVEDWSLFRPVWSPDSKQLALHNMQGDLFLVQVNGKGARPVTQGMKVKATWSPDGKRLALWPLGRYGEVSTNPAELERFLPPVGKEEATLSDAEIIKRYFLRVLTKSSSIEYLGGFLGTYVDFLEAHARTLAQQNKGEKAQRYFCQGLEEVVDTKPWREQALGPELEGTYAACQRQGKEETDKDSLEAKVPQSAFPYLKKLAPWTGGVEPREAGERVRGRVQNTSKRPSAERAANSQQPPSLYIVEISEKVQESESR